MLNGVLSGTAVAGALALGYQSMAPTGQWYGRTFTGLPRGSKQLALTFDDGPNDPHTLRLLEVLARQEVKATFFLIGRYVQEKPDIVREVLAAGHAIGNHTHTHPLLIFKGGAQIENELQSCEKATFEATGVRCTLFRPPSGGRRPAVLRVARRLGYLPVMWNVTGFDWNAPSAEYIERKITGKVRGGDVILLHDGGHLQMGTDRSRTVTVTERLITRYKAEDYEFVRIPEMMAAVGKFATALGSGRDPSLRSG